MKNRKLNPFTVHVPPEHCLTCNHKHNEKIMYFDPKQKNHTRKIRTLSVQYTRYNNHNLHETVKDIPSQHKKGARNQH